MLSDTCGLCLLCPEIKVQREAQPWGAIAIGTGKDRLLQAYVCFCIPAPKSSPSSIASPSGQLQLRLCLSCAPDTFAVPTCQISTLGRCWHPEPGSTGAGDTKAGSWR